MKGVIFILIIYIFAILISIIVKLVLTNYFPKKNKGSKPPAPKIYYIKNTPKAPPKRPKNPDIAVKGRIIEKND